MAGRRVVQFQRRRASAAFLELKWRRSRQSLNRPIKYPKHGSQDAYVCILSGVFMYAEEATRLCVMVAKETRTLLRCMLGMFDSVSPLLDRFSLRRRGCAARLFGRCHLLKASRPGTRCVMASNVGRRELRRKIDLDKHNDCYMSKLLTREKRAVKVILDNNRVKRLWKNN